MKRETQELLKRAARVAHLIGDTIELNMNTFDSALALDIDVAIGDLKQLLADAHHAEYGL